MAMLADSVEIMDSDEDGIVFKYETMCNFTSGQDVHVWTRSGAMDRGYVWFALNNSTTDYIELSRNLRKA